MSPLVSLTRRAAVAADAAALAEVYEAYDVPELGQVEMELPDIESMLALDGSDRLAVEADGRLVGYADVGRSGEVETVVDPAYDGARDLHRELLTWVVERATERRLGRIEHFAGPDPQRAGALLASAGFVHVRTIWRMARPLSGDLPEPVWPDGVRLRAFERDRDARDVWQVVMTSFAGAYGSHQRPFDEWSLLALGEGHDVVCARQDDALIGVATTAVRVGVGHVGQLGVLPEHRGRGLARALLHECFRRDAAAGLATTTLTVDGENDTARRLYESVGMTAEREYRRWERDV